MKENASSDFKFVRPASPVPEAQASLIQDDELIIVGGNSSIAPSESASIDTDQSDLADRRIASPSGVIITKDDATLPLTGTDEENEFGQPMPVAQKIVIALAGIGVVVLAIYLVIHWLF